MNAAPYQVLHDLESKCFSVVSMRGDQAVMKRYTYLGKYAQAAERDAKNYAHVLNLVYDYGVTDGKLAMQSPFSKMTLADRAALRQLGKQLSKQQT